MITDLTVQDPLFFCNHNTNTSQHYRNHFTLTYQFYVPAEGMIQEEFQFKLFTSVCNDLKFLFACMNDTVGQSQMTQKKPKTVLPKVETFSPRKLHLGILRYTVNLDTTIMTAPFKFCSECNLHRLMHVIIHTRWHYCYV